MFETREVAGSKLERSHVRNSRGRRFESREVAGSKLEGVTRSNLGTVGGPLGYVRRSPHSFVFSAAFSAFSCGSDSIEESRHSFASLFSLLRVYEPTEY